ncbi:MAG: VanZ family protein [Lachnospiraceae bacterium]|nr:VanZ family protein [Lachnospiraceae bacterium]
METFETREVFTILTVLWFCVMCFFTFQLGPGTIAVSGRLTKVVESVIGIAFYTDEEVLERRIRFLAHPIEFFILTVLTLKAVGRSGAIIIVVALILWSVISEVLKVRIPGRHCNGIDMVGNIIGVGIGVLISVLATMM